MITSVVAAGCNRAADVSARVGSSTSPPPAPAARAVAGFSQISVYWEDVSGANSYNILVSCAPGAALPAGTKITDVSSPFTPTGLPVSTTCNFIVTAVNTAGEGLPSAPVTATTTW